MEDAAGRAGCEAEGNHGRRSAYDILGGIVCCVRDMSESREGYSGSGGR